MCTYLPPSPYGVGLSLDAVLAQVSSGWARSMPPPPPPLPPSPPSPPHTCEYGGNTPPRKPPSAKRRRTSSSAGAGAGRGTPPQQRHAGSESEGDDSLTDTENALVQALVSGSGGV